MIKRKYILIVLILLFAVGIDGEEMKKHPGWAIIATALLPGGGQFYAENYARGLFFSALQMSLLTMTIYEKIQEKDYKSLWEKNQEQAMWDEYNKHRGRVRNLLWWDTGIWFLACADAFTDAHFYGFGDEDGLSFQFNNRQDRIQVGINIRF